MEPLPPDDLHLLGLCGFSIAVARYCSMQMTYKGLYDCHYLTSQPFQYYSGRFEGTRPTEVCTEVPRVNRRYVLYVHELNKLPPIRERKVN